MLGGLGVVAWRLARGARRGAGGARAGGVKGSPRRSASPRRPVSASRGVATSPREGGGVESRSNPLHSSPRKGLSPRPF